MGSKFIGENIRQLRKDAGLTCRELADDLDLHHATISKWETGKRDITPEWMETLADYFGVTIEELEYGVMR